MATINQTVSRIRIHVSRDKVWEGLTRHELIQKYFTDARIRVDWRLNGKASFQGYRNGEYLEAHGQITHLEHGYTVTLEFEPPIGKLTLTLVDLTEWQIFNINDKPTVELTLTQDGYESRRDRTLSEERWKIALNELKGILEG